MKAPEYMGPKGIAWAIENYRHNGVHIFEVMRNGRSTREKVDDRKQVAICQS